MERFFCFAAWRRRPGPNGFILLDLCVAAVLMALLLAAMLPLTVQIIRTCREGEAWEELSRQGMVLEETIYGDLRVSHGHRVTNNTIRYLDEENLSSGFSVGGSTVYRIMSNNVMQPLTGGAKGSSRIRVQPQPDIPYFSQHGDVLQVHIVLYDTVSGQTWPCILYITPMQTYWGTQ